MGDETTVPDWDGLGGREVAPALARAVLRLLAALGAHGIAEVPLRSGRRVDVMALDRNGAITVVEIKSSIADFRSDRKWPEYLDYCERFFFAVPAGFPVEILPAEQGLIVADRFEAAIVREAPLRVLNPARRKNLTLRFARTAAERLRQRDDPGPAFQGATLSGVQR
ncbi:MmcB family DNA repair protein [Oceanibacterium hippocampi]|uniref:DNA repair protein MmcB-related protein n=1 Tax=Oceanibacterium hippocampi TaxID=745714 RepID=A0A1Y5RP98_9PROT|nr:MmcB family DNA repair protein [Oceanibacterium hippocampi]SLN21128.1 hypothetical protein OCH7691_00528 [Oceanibacterium hippocampi]